ncbi:hypothetical protein [Mycolicibacterium phocaicum]|uniref:hypothetical protein n=1 Tax=Mycolicibacterium phocaicum TaxID=319706 RepID=UPI0010FE60C1|nr:hypothetical protein [Mycolicibacterium phocaicum]BBZ55905.1 hypothetical protein MPHO_28970 [Mycolicibacterium phocaicum]
MSEAVEQSKAKWRKAISILRDTGMTDDEIAAELGLPDLKEFETQHVSTSAVRPAKSTAIVVQHDLCSVDDSDGILDVEVVDLSTDGAMGEPLPHLPVPIPARESDSNREHEPRDWSKSPVPERRCKAHKKNGERCKNAAIVGGTVCRYHGGASAHVQRTARARLENAADRMAKELLGMAIDPNVADSVKLAAIKDALDRGGLKAPNQVVVSAGQTTGFDEIYTDVFTGTRAESRRARGMELGPNDVDALGYSSSSSEQSSAAVIDADGFDVTDSFPNNEGVQRFSPDTDISAAANRPGGGFDPRYGGVGPNSYADYDRLGATEEQ